MGLGGVVRRLGKGRPPRGGRPPEGRGDALILEESRGHTPISRDSSLPAVGGWFSSWGGVNLTQFGAEAEAAGPCVFGSAPYSTLLMTSTPPQQPASRLIAEYPPGIR